MADFWEIVKGFGAIVGLITGCFVLWERLVKERPLIFIVAQPLTPGNVNKVACLRIINRSVRPLLISWRSGFHDNALHIARDDSVREIVSAFFPGEPIHVIDGNETADLKLLTPNKMREIDPDNIIETELRWSFVQPVIWQRPRRLRIRITKRAYLALLGEKAEQYVEGED
ncbi:MULTISPECIES: hypothetical protein [unclassified Bradyrhizobium]